MPRPRLLTRQKRATKKQQQKNDTQTEQQKLTRKHITKPGVPRRRLRGAGHELAQPSLRVSEPLRRPLRPH